LSLDKNRLNSDPIFQAQGIDDVTRLQVNPNSAVARLAIARGPSEIRRAAALSLQGRLLNASGRVFMVRAS